MKNATNVIVIVVVIVINTGVHIKLIKTVSKSKGAAQ
jgi:hypothetical protein